MTTYTPEQVTEARALAAKAAADLETNGWYQGNYFPVDGFIDAPDTDIPENCPSCVLGALARATGQGSLLRALNLPAFEAAEELIMEAVRARGSVWQHQAGPGIWNDHADTTVGDILEVLREVADGGGSEA